VWFYLRKILHPLSISTTSFPNFWPSLSRSSHLVQLHLSRKPSNLPLQTRQRHKTAAWARKTYTKETESHCCSIDPTRSLLFVFFIFDRETLHISCWIQHQIPYHLFDYTSSSSSSPSSSSLLQDSRIKLFVSFRRIKILFFLIRVDLVLNSASNHFVSALISAFSPIPRHNKRKQTTRQPSQSRRRYIPATIPKS